MSTLRERVAGDRKRFLNTRDFGELATFTAVGATAKRISVNQIASWEASSQFGLELENAEVVALCSAAEVGDAKPNSQLTLNGVTYYTICPPKANGYGLAVLELSRNEV